MFAVVKTGGKQYRVAANDVLKVARVAGEPGDVVTLADVLLVQDGDKVHVAATGARVDGVTVAAEIVEHGRDAKVIAFKKRRRQNSKRKRGHRQEHTVVRITEILTGGAKPSAKAGATKAKAAPKKAKADAATETAQDAPAATTEA